MEWLSGYTIRILALPAIFCLAWTLAELRKRRSLREFGDPAVLNSSFCWTPAILGALLIAVTLGSAVAVILIPGKSEAVETRPQVTELLVDSEAFDNSHPLSAQYWDNLRSTIREIGDSAGLLELYRSGPEVEMIVPATTDMQGLEILVRRHQMLWQSGSASHLEQSIKSLLRQASAGRRSGRLVVFTARAIEDLTDFRLDVNESVGVRLIFVRLPTVTNAMQYGFSDAHGKWVWEPASSGFPKENPPLPGIDGSAPWTSGQFFALMAYICLLSESLLILWPANLEL